MLLKITVEQQEIHPDPCRLPVPPGERMESLRFFLYSCANWGYGYFNAYDVGSRYNLDFWVHLGDYVGASLAAAAAFLTYKCTVYLDVMCSANNKGIGRIQ